MRKLRIDKFIQAQESGRITPSQAAERYTGNKNSRSMFYAVCWRRHLQLVAERRYRRAKR